MLSRRQPPLRATKLRHPTRCSVHGQFLPLLSRSVASCPHSTARCHGLRLRFRCRTAPIQAVWGRRQEADGDPCQDPRPSGHGGFTQGLVDNLRGASAGLEGSIAALDTLLFRYGRDANPRSAAPPVEETAQKTATWSPRDEAAEEELSKDWRGGGVGGGRSDPPWKRRVTPADADKAGERLRAAARQAAQERAMRSCSPSRRSQPAAARQVRPVVQGRPVVAVVVQDSFLQQGPVVEAETALTLSEMGLSLKGVGSGNAPPHEEEVAVDREALERLLPGWSYDDARLEQGLSLLPELNPAPESQACDLDMVVATGGVEEAPLHPVPAVTAAAFLPASALLDQPPTVERELSPAVATRSLDLGTLPTSAAHPHTLTHASASMQLPPATAAGVPNARQRSDVDAIGSGGTSGGPRWEFSSGVLAQDVEVNRGDAMGRERWAQWEVASWTRSEGADEDGAAVMGDWREEWEAVRASGAAQHWGASAHVESLTWVGEDVGHGRDVDSGTSAVGDPEASWHARVPMGVDSLRWAGEDGAGAGPVSAENGGGLMTVGAAGGSCGRSGSGVGKEGMEEAVPQGAAVNQVAGVEMGVAMVARSPVVCDLVGAEAGMGVAGSAATPAASIMAVAAGTEISAAAGVAGNGPAMSKVAQCGGQGSQLLARRERGAEEVDVEAGLSEFARLVRLRAEGQLAGAPGSDVDVFMRKALDLDEGMLAGLRRIKVKTQTSAPGSTGAALPASPQQRSGSLKGFMNNIVPGNGSPPGSPRYRNWRRDGGQGEIVGGASPHSPRGAAPGGGGGELVGVASPRAGSTADGEGGQMLAMQPVRGKSLAARRGAMLGLRFQEDLRPPRLLPAKVPAVGSNTTVERQLDLRAEIAMLEELAFGLAPEHVLPSEPALQAAPVGAHVAPADPASAAAGSVVPARAMQSGVGGRRAPTVDLAEELAAIDRLLESFKAVDKKIDALRKHAA